MHYSTLLATALSATTALAFPHTLTSRATNATTYNTTATYYQGGSGSDGSCGFVAVASGNLTSGVCNIAYTYSLTVQPLATRDCEYVLWTGTQHCGDISAGQKSFLPAGGHPVCVTTGVLDGGTHTYASGMFTCDVDIN